MALTWGSFALGALVSLSACAPLPTETDSERLDSGTGTTVTLMPRPVELVILQAKAGKTDPFAYLAPFETNRMGTHEMYLWVSAPQVAGPLGVPKVFCGEQLMPLEEAQPDIKAMGLSRAPYKTPAPWSREWYFKLSGEVLDCVTSANRVKVTTQATEAEPEDYAAEAAALAGLKEFAARVRT
ncbi:MAG TPA: hypothetical protein VGO53_08105 [Steroidobacteraceae bacterium]|nr:hypothetical protein [Steroidobacteraceae bacterium]